MPKGWVPYRGDGLPRRDPDRYVLKERSLFKRILHLLVFIIIGLAISYLIGRMSHLGTGALIFSHALSSITAVIIYFAKEDAEKIDIHDVHKMPEHHGDDDNGTYRDESLN
ncbi:MAG: hypothetical protein U0Z26_05145 [Anaerolineales bacterium]